jgi:hypothetical protein
MNEEIDKFGEWLQPLSPQYVFPSATRRPSNLDGKNCNFARFLYIYEINHLTLRGEQWLRVSHNKLFMRTFGPKREEVTGGWRNLRNGELHYWSSSPNYIISIIKSMRMGWTRNIVHVGEMRSACRIAVGKAEGKWVIGRFRCSWKGNIRLSVKKHGGRWGLDS